MTGKVRRLPVRDDGEGEPVEDDRRTAFVERFLPPVPPPKPRPAAGKHRDTD